MERVVLLSDFHLGVGSTYNVEDFYSDAAFQHFVDSPLLAPRSGDSTHLVLLGDTFDLWQVALNDGEYTTSSAEAIPVAYAVEDEIARLRRVHSGHPRFFAALAEFARRPNCLVTLLPGNHDHALVEPRLQRELLRLTACNLRFATNFDRPDLGLYAEHGNQWDSNNTYQDFTRFSWEDECPGYFFVRLFWNRLETLAPDLIDSPGGWKGIWHYLSRLGNPLLLARAILFWVQYRSDRRVPAHVHLGLNDVTEHSPDLLLTAHSMDGNVFSNDPAVEHAFRQAYHAFAEVRQVVDAIRPKDAAAVPLPDARAGLEGLGAMPVELGAYDESGAAALFRQRPTGREGPLEPSVYRYVLFGHTHKRLEVLLLNRAWYFNTGTWTGRNPTDLTVVVVESDDGAVRAAFGRFLGGQIQLGDWR